jgi:hypothetical protein
MTIEPIISAVLNARDPLLISAPTIIAPITNIPIPIAFRIMRNIEKFLYIFR